MEIKDISRELKGQAVLLGLCDQWTNEWGTPDQQGLIDKYKKGMDFVIQHNYPTLDFIKQNFDKELLHKNMIFVDEKVSLYKQSGTAVVNGKCSGEIEAEGFDVIRVYVRHDSEITFKCGGLSKVFIDLHDNATCRIEQTDMAKVYVYMHDNATETHKGEVIVRKK